MKEKIAEWFDYNAYPVKGLEGDLTYNQWKEESTGEILSLIREEIEKMKNPYANRPLFFDKDSGFEEARQAILKALES